MAQQTIVSLVDDIDGNEAVGTVTFAVDGTNYEIDLNQKNLDKFRKAIQPYVDHARTVKPAPAPGRTRNTRRAARSTDGPTPQQVREWATANDITVSARGRVAQSVIDAYNQAHAN